MKRTEHGFKHYAPSPQTLWFLVTCCGEWVDMEPYVWAGLVRWTGRCPVCGVVHYTEDVPVEPPPLEVDV